MLCLLVPAPSCSALLLLAAQCALLHPLTTHTTRSPPRRSIAMRIMEIRSQMAVEFIQDLSPEALAEENSTL